MDANENNAAGTTTTTTANMETDDADLNKLTWTRPCHKCGVEYDLFDSGHIFLCGVCVVLFPEEARLPSASPTADEPSKKAPRNKGSIQCRKPGCGKWFNRTPNNNGKDCTYCCEIMSNTGKDAFTPEGMQPPERHLAMIARAQARLANAPRQQPDEWVHQTVPQ